ncbi:unnamed protein product [Nyctereutes procyonoides]|uniref:(raccoon dog) hypothetical protein n=1 Tax=Nyctereutes procyonoides TaxID=34880 RepID=A0A811ZQZ8_NYCPR|nr:unnamed protein product [Nyctereutes procyonoides]
MIYEITEHFLENTLQQLKCHFTWNLYDEESSLHDLENSFKAIMYNLFSFIKHLRGQNKAALEYLQQAKEFILHGHACQGIIRSLVTWGNYSWVYYHMHRLPESTGNCPVLYELERPEIDCEKGWALLKFGGKYYQRAKAAFEKALEAEPDDLEFNISYAITIYWLDHSDHHRPTKSSSLGPRKKAVTLNPANAYIKMYMQKLKWKGILKKSWTRYLPQISSQLYVLCYTARFYRRKNSWDNALELLKKGLERHKRSKSKATGNRPSGEEKWRVDRLLTMLLSHFRVAVQQDSTFAFVYTDLANMYAEGVQDSKAEEEFYCKSESTAIHHYSEALKIRDCSSLCTKLTSALKTLAGRLGHNASDLQSL